jgi:hypothetical protein
MHYRDIEENNVESVVQITSVLYRVRQAHPVRNESHPASI